LLSAYSREDSIVLSRKKKLLLMMPGSRSIEDPEIMTKHSEKVH